MGRASRAAHAKVSIARDLADDIRWKVEPTGNDAPMRSAADVPDEVSKPVDGPLGAERAAKRGGGLILRARGGQESDPLRSHPEVRRICRWFLGQQVAADERSDRDPREHDGRVGAKQRVEDGVRSGSPQAVLAKLTSGLDLWGQQHIIQP
jgi:hypothetical protein